MKKILLFTLLSSGALLFTVSFGQRLGKSNSLTRRILTIWVDDNHRMRSEAEVINAETISRLFSHSSMEGFERVFGTDGSGVFLTGKLASIGGLCFSPNNMNWQISLNTPCAVMPWRIYSSLRSRYIPLHFSMYNRKLSFSRESAYRTGLSNPFNAIINAIPLPGVLLWKRIRPGTN